MRKAINFDMDTKKLKEKGFEHLSTPYSLVKNFMINNNFIHQQGSGYVSQKQMNKKEILKIINKMKNELPWAIGCFSDIVVSNIDEKQFNLTSYFNEEIDNSSIEDKKIKLSNDIDFGM